MEATQSASEPIRPIRTVLRGVAWFLLIPLLAVLVMALGAAWQIDQYEQAHSERIFTGVTVQGVDLSGKTMAEAATLLRTMLPAANGPNVTLVDPESGVEWEASAAELGVDYDIAGALDAAYAIGRTGDRQAQLREQFTAWYRGYPLAASIVIDQGALDALLAEVAQEIEQPTVDSSLEIMGSSVSVVDGQFGRMLDTVDARSRLVSTVTALEPARIELLVHNAAPRLVDADDAANLINQIIGNPVEFYFAEPLDGVDLQNVVLPKDRLVEWLRVVQADEGRYEVSLDEAAASAWLTQFAARIAREPERARFYFDDFTGELVLIEPHVDGRYLDVDTTVARLLEAVNTPNRAVPFAIEKIVPVVNSNATAADLGITELLSEGITQFAGSSPERMANIARAASNFYGIVIAPGEEFSFNHYLGEISEDQGYERGLIIAGGRTIEGIGGGVCQVSTTLFQAAFFSGLDIGSGQRWPHGYRVNYYESGLGPGFDATIYSPEIDFTFTNDTPHHLLIENYYNEGLQSLTFKLYSTSIGRTVEWERWIENETEPRPDVYEFSDKLDPGVIEQVDWAVPGADVTVRWTVYNQWGELRHQKDFVSNYIPWANVYQYGPDTNIDN